MAGRVLGIDPGDVRVGLARSDPLGIIAQPLGFLEFRNVDQLVRDICKNVGENEIGTVVVGLPLLLSGEEGAKATEARELAAKLQEALPGMKVILWDERMTTVQAEKAMIADNVSRGRRKKKIDTVAATIILQSYLDSLG